ncbi:MAG: Ku protein [Candidatus Methanoperedens sp.]
MTRAMSTINIRFGMINVPVKLHKANKDGDVHFKNVHAVCHSPLKQKKWCDVCNREVLSTELNKGFVLAKDKIIEFSELELEAIAVAESKHLIVEKVVEISEIPSTAADSFYFLQPDKYAEHAYSLIAKVLSVKNKAMIGRIILRSKEHLAAIQFCNGGLLLTTLHWHDELYSIYPLLEKLETIPDEELILASMLLDRMQMPFAHESFKDTYRNKVLDVVEKKAKGEVITITQTIVEAPKQTDMMAELKRSLEMSCTIPAAQTVARA